MHLAMTRTVVHDQGLFVGNGAFESWMRKINTQLEIKGLSEAPVGWRANKSDGTSPGHLAESIDSEFQHLTLRTYELTFEATASYAAYVHEGTGTIRAGLVTGDDGRKRFASPENAEGMWLPSNGPFRGMWRQRVRGQSANPFLRRAFNRVAASHPALGHMWE